MPNKPDDNNYTPTRYSLKTSLVLILGAIFIAGSFYAIHFQRMSEALCNTRLAAEAVFAHENNAPQHDLSHLSNKALALLKLRHIHAVALMNEKGEIVLSEGIPLPSKTINEIRQGALEVRQGNILTFASTLETQTDQPIRLLVEIDLRSESLINLQFIFICTLILITIFAVIVYINHRLSRDIFQPLEDFNEELSKNNNLKSIAPIKISNAGIFSELIQQTNESFDIQTEQTEEYKKSIEVATQELRESLETVEIQNIDLDIARKNAVELNKLKSNFLKKTSQDLLTPLRGILNFIELIQNQPLSTDQKEYIATIEDSARGMLTLVNDINDFSRLETSKLQLEKKPLDVKNSIESVLTLQSSAAKNSNVTLLSTFDHGVPAAIMGDALRLQQVIANLVSNAIKFDNASFVHIDTHSTKTESDEVELIICIQTDGICPDSVDLRHDAGTEITNISKAFYSRTGMSLIVAKSLSQQMKGEVSFETKDGLSGFELKLRCAPVTDYEVGTQTIDPSYRVNALVFSNTDIGYREISSRLSDASIKVHRASTFSDIVTTANSLHDNQQKHARYLTLAVIEAQTSEQTLDKIVLTQTLKTLTRELNIPTIVIAASGRNETLQNIVNDTEATLIHRPLISTRFKNCILELLDIVTVKNDQHSDAKSAEFKPIHILIVDDNHANLKLSKALLDDFNVVTHAASTGSKALELTQEKNFDLIFMDIELPDIDGYATTQKIREFQKKEARTPIVALTAHDIRDKKADFLLSGMDDVVEKPLSTSDISVILDRWVIGAQHKNSEAPSPSTTQKRTPRPTVSDTQPIASPVNISESLNLAKNNAELAKDMLVMLLESLPKERDKINACAINTDLRSMYETVHKLYGACCYCGTPRLRHITQTLDRKLRDNDEDKLTEFLEELYSAIDELLIWQEDHDIDALFD